MTRPGHPLACLLLATAIPSSAEAEASPPVSVCEIDANRETFVGREVLAEGRVIRTAHGYYTELRECPDIYLMVFVAGDARPETRTRLQDVASNVGQPEASWKPPVILRARVELNDHTLLLTSHVTKRLMLAVLDVEPVASTS